MNDKPGLRIIFGVTGHRDISDDDLPALENSVHDIFARFRKEYPNTGFVLFSPLAAGADRLVARIALAAGVELHVPMPFLKSEYVKDFTPSEAVEFETLLARAHRSFDVALVPGTDRDNVSRNERRALQYQKVGHFLAEVSDVLIALWDGVESDLVGGTASVVSYRLNGVADLPKEPSSLLESPLRGAVYHVCTSRISGKPLTTAGQLVIRTRYRQLGPESDPSRQIFDRINRFNKDVADLVPTRGVTFSTTGIRIAAEMLATSFQMRFRFALATMFVLATSAALALASAHGREPNFSEVLAYVALLSGSYAVYATARNYEWLPRSIEYRALEVALSIQELWDLVGCEKKAADSYLKIQRNECDWIRRAVQSVYVLTPRETASEKSGLRITRDFVDRQRAFFKRAYIRDTRLAAIFEAIARTFVFLGIASTIALLYFVAYPLVFHSHAVVSGARQEYADFCIRGIITFTILAAVTHEYPKRCAFVAQARRYDAMLPIFERASEILSTARLNDDGDFDRLARDVAAQVGSECIVENGEWVLMHRDLPLDHVDV